MIYLILPSLIWGFSYGLIKFNLAGLDANFVTFCRMGFALPIFLPFLKLKKLAPRHIVELITIGAIQYGLMYLCFIRAFQYLSAHEAALFSMVTPIYIIIINNILEKKRTSYFLFTAILSMIGGGVVYYQSSLNSGALIGFALVQVADICFAYGQVAYKRLRASQKGVQDLDVFALLYVGAFSVAALATTYTNGWHSMSLLSTQACFTLMYLGAVASGICFFWWNKGATIAHTGTLAIFNNMKGPIAIIISIIFFKEHANLPQVSLGVGLILFALFLSERQAKRCNTF